MTKQDEIREGIRRELAFSVEDTEYWEIGNHFALKDKAITKLLTYLASQGVAIKVEGELPKLKRRFRGDYNTGYAHCRQDAFEAGYTAWEDLV